MISLWHLVWIVQYAFLLDCYLLRFCAVTTDRREKHGNGIHWWREHRRARQGERRAGRNQTGRELRKQAYYDHTKGWYVFRARNPLVREDIAVAMENSIANRNIGYDQLQNQTLWNQIKSKGYDPTRATTPCETDCARLVRVCVAYGFDQNGLDASTVPIGIRARCPNSLWGWVSLSSIRTISTARAGAPWRVATSSARAAKGIRWSH